MTRPCNQHLGKKIKNTTGTPEAPLMPLQSHSYLAAMMAATPSIRPACFEFSINGTTHYVLFCACFVHSILYLQNDPIVHSSSLLESIPFYKYIDLLKSISVMLKGILWYFQLGAITKKAAIYIYSCTRLLVHIWVHAHFCQLHPGVGMLVLGYTDVPSAWEILPTASFLKLYQPAFPPQGIRVPGAEQAR